MPRKVGLRLSRFLQLKNGHQWWGVRHIRSSACLRILLARLMFKLTILVECWDSLKVATFGTLLTFGLSRCCTWVVNWNIGCVSGILRQAELQINITLPYWRASETFRNQNIFKTTFSRHLPPTHLLRVGLVTWLPNY